MGQRTGLSAGDIAGVAAMYPGVSTFKEVPKDPIFDTTRKEVAKDPIKDPIKDVHKDPVTDPTIKEAHKDPLTDPTIKETHKDPISDPTHKELTKDPIFDGTLKEAAGDPGGGGGTLVETIGRPHIPGVPFVMAEPSNFGAQSPAASPDLSSQVQALGQAIVAIQQQLAQVAAAHDALVQSLGGQQG